jgi:hypothetical protein
VFRNQKLSPQGETIQSLPLAACDAETLWQ